MLAAVRALAVPVAEVAAVADTPQLAAVAQPQVAELTDRVRPGEDSPGASAGWLAWVL